MAVPAALELLAGLALLLAGSEMLVRAAVRIASRSGMSTLAVGLTVVAFGTSAPELAVSIGAALHDHPEIALGNVVGSNISNLLLILGASALFVPLAVSRPLVRWDIPLTVAVSLVVLLMALDGRLGRWDGAVLLAGGAAYAWAARTRSLPRRGPSTATGAARAGSHGRDLLQVGGGLVALTLGAHVLVRSAAAMAEAAGVPHLVVGLTVVALGTSLPELATTLVATLRGQRDLAVGNIIGSSLFNLLGVLGIAALATPAGVPVGRAALQFDLPVMVVVALACLPVFLTGRRIARWEGVLFVGYYAAYIAYRWLEARGSDWLPGFTLAMAAFVAPLTVLTASVAYLHGRSRRHRLPPGD